MLFECLLQGQIRTQHWHNDDTQITPKHEQLMLSYSLIRRFKYSRLSNRPIGSTWLDLYSW